jgi:cytoskeletal protein CcmA (bactofilin family)
MTTSPGNGSPSGASRLQSFIDRDSHLTGTHTTPNDLYIEGHFEGTIECAGALFIAESADVNAHITAGSVAVAGHLQGEVVSRGRFEMLASGRAETRVVAGTIVIHEGARYEGELRMGSGEGGIGQITSLPRADQRAARRSGSGESGETAVLSRNTARANGRLTESWDTAQNARPNQSPPAEA